MQTDIWNRLEAVIPDFESCRVYTVICTVFVSNCTFYYCDVNVFRSNYTYPTPARKVSQLKEVLQGEVTSYLKSLCKIYPTLMPATDGDRLVAFLSEEEDTLMLLI